ncbi:MAG: hypothetical protein ACO2ZN_03740 [Paracoccaceae bacterium]
MHFGHYISGSAHAGILSWLLVGSWFAPPEPAPFEAVSVAMISNSEFEAMMASDQSPEAAQSTSEVAPPSDVEEETLRMPEKEQLISKAAEPAIVSVNTVQDAQLQKPEPLKVPAPRLADQLPSLSTPSDNQLALLKAPEILDAPQTANRVSAIAVAPPPSGVNLDDQILQTALPLNLDAPANVQEPEKETDLGPSVQPETAVENSPEVSKELPKAPEISLRPKSTIPQPQGTETTPEVSEAPPEPPKSAAPASSLRPRSRPVSQQALAEEPKDPVQSPNSMKEGIDAALKEGNDAAPSNTVTGIETSRLTGEQEGIIRDTVINAMRPNWNIITGSPASFVALVVRLEFDRNGTVKEDSIELISHEGGNDRAVRTAFRAAKTAIKMASLKGAFKLPAETFDGWKVLELEFDPEEMRKR